MSSFGADQSEEDCTITMFYDDELDVNSLGTIETIEEQTATSGQVRVLYDEDSGTYSNSLSDTDSAVIEQNGNVLHAVGVGTAIAQIGGSEYKVIVKPAPLSLFLIIGQSNAEGIDGNSGQSVICENGTVYSTAYNLYEKGLMRSSVASCLAGKNRYVAVDGTQDYLSDCPIHMLTESGSGKPGLDSGLAYQWRKEFPDEKVWIVNAAIGGTSIRQWQPDAGVFQDAVTVFRAAQAVLNAEVCAGHYELRHMGYFWLQGESDILYTAQEYVTAYGSMHAGLKQQLGVQIKDAFKTLEFGNILLARAAWFGADGAGLEGYRRGTYPEEDYYPTGFKGTSCRDLEMTGPRVAQYYMGNSNLDLFKDVNLVCDIGDQWVYSPDGSTNGAAAYFRSAYPSGEIDYPVREGSPSLPAKPEELLPILHYQQMGYNELGREAARNTAALLKGTQVKPAVEFASWNGFDSFRDGDTAQVGTVDGSDSLLVPRVHPLYMSKQVSCETSPEVNSSYYDFTLKNDPETGIQPGTLTAVFEGLPIASVRLEDFKSPAMAYSQDITGFLRKGDILYFGYASELPENAADPQKTQPIQWSVANPSQANGGLTDKKTDGLWLWATHSWGAIPFARAPWLGNTAQEWCSTFFETNFSAMEMEALLGFQRSGTSNGIMGIYSTIRDKVYLLSADEAQQAGMALLENKTDYWLRSFTDDGSQAYYWNSAENPYDSNVGTKALPYDPNTDELRIEGRPAVNLDYDKITFFSQADESSGGGKALGNNGITPVEQSSLFRRWKVTVSCDYLNALTIDTKSIRVSGEGTLSGTFTYLQGNGVPANQISAIVKDADDHIQYYGKVTDLTGQDTVSGTFTIENYASLRQAGSIYLFAEQRNGSYRTDYAGRFYKLPEPSQTEEHSGEGKEPDLTKPDSGHITNDTVKKVSLKKAVIKKLVAGKKKLTIYVKDQKATGIDGYKIYYRVKGTSKWKSKILKAGKTKLVLKKLKSGKKYQVYARGFAKISGKVKYGKRSKIKTSKAIK